MESFRKETDSLGEVTIPSHALWGAQTERSRDNFPLRELSMPYAVIRALVLIKKAAAHANASLGLLSQEKASHIQSSCEEILGGKYRDQFPLSVFQTGSGTQSNMNVNEVIANLASEKMGGKRGEKRPVHPNDDVNMSQSSNDVFPTAMHIAAVVEIETKLIPALNSLINELQVKARQFTEIVKVGRTHLMDAAPLTLGAEFSGYAASLTEAKLAVEQTLPQLRELALGGTAVGTGLNCPPGFAEKAVAEISGLTGTHFTVSPNYFQALSSHEALVFASGALKTVASSLFKIASDIRLMGSGPRAGFSELYLPENEPGSSIMPGKVNPTQSEAITMIAAQVFGCDSAISFASTQGHFELNVFKPVIIYNFLLAVHLLAEGADSFRLRCVEGLLPNKEQLAHNIENTLMMAAALNPIVGYDNAAKIVQKAHKEKKSLKQAALELKLLTEEEFDRAIDPRRIASPHKTA